MSKYSYLNLNQKMIKIRKKIPALIRKRYSEDVDYDFVKLDDINQFLTPALNRYGVDFDILREIPTRKDASGNPIFLTAEGNLWRYEADLEICWTNADHPEEKSCSVLHLVGTNDMADKAKGTAMTYGLKYYLLNKFNIPQNGDEDPDMRGNAAGEGKEKAAPKGKESGKKAEPKPSRTVKDENTAKTVKREKPARAAAMEKNVKENIYQPADLEEGLKEASSPSGNTRMSEKTARDGNEMYSGKEESREMKIHPIRETEKASGKKTETASEMAEEKEGGKPKEEGQISFLEEEGILPNEKEEASRPVSGEETQEDAELEEEEEKDIGDGFRSVKDEDDVPFSDFEDEEEIYEEEEDTNQEDKVEQAKAVICNFGLYKGHSLGEMLESVKGWETLKWISTRYTGANTQIKEAATLLVTAKAYEPKAA